MDVSGSLHTLRRHWVLTTLLVLLTLLMAEAAWVKIPGPYQSQSQVALLASQQASQPNGNNPYLTFDGSLITTADIVRREVLDPRIVTALAARGFTDSYEVQNDPLGIGPVLDIIVTGGSKASVEATQSAVTAEVQTELQQLQEGHTAQEPDHQHGGVQQPARFAPGQQEGEASGGGAGVWPHPHPRHPADRGCGDEPPAEPPPEDPTATASCRDRGQRSLIR